MIAKDKIPLEDMRYHRPARAGLRTERHTSSGSSERFHDSDFVIGDEPDDVEVPGDSDSVKKLPPGARKENSGDWQDVKSERNVSKTNQNRHFLKKK